MSSLSSQKPRSIQRGDIVLCEDGQWEVAGRTEEPGLAGKGPAATLLLERTERHEAPTPYGQKQKYRKVTVHKHIAEGRVRLVAHQAALL